MPFILKLFVIFPELRNADDFSNAGNLQFSKLILKCSLWILDENANSGIVILITLEGMRYLDFERARSGSLRNLCHCEGDLNELIFDL